MNLSSMPALTHEPSEYEPIFRPRAPLARHPNVTANLRRFACIAIELQQPQEPSLCFVPSVSPPSFSLPLHPSFDESTDWCERGLFYGPFRATPAAYSVPFYGPVPFADPPRFADSGPPPGCPTFANQLVSGTFALHLILLPPTSTPLTGFQLACLRCFETILT